MRHAVAMLMTPSNSKKTRRSNSVPPGIRIYPYHHAYLAEMVDLWIAAWNQAMPAIDFETRRGWIGQRIITHNDQGGETACALNAGNGDIAGFVTYVAASGSIDQLVVRPDYWSSAAARILIDACKKAAPGRLLLDVNQDNPRAVRFYEREGFRCVGEGLNPNSGLKTWHYEWRA